MSRIDGSHQTGPILDQTTGPDSLWSSRKIQDELDANAGSDVSGPESSTLNAIPRFADTTGKIIKDSNVVIANSGAITVASAYTLPIVDGAPGFQLTTDGSGNLSWTCADGAGDVAGPPSSTDNSITRFNGTTGKSIQNSVIEIDDAGALYPSVDQAGGLGTLTNRFSEVHTMDITTPKITAPNDYVVFDECSALRPSTLRNTDIGLVSDTFRELHIQDVKCQGTVYADTLAETTENAGVYVEAVRIKDGTITINNNQYTFPLTDGTSSLDVLATDGAGNCYWRTVTEHPPANVEPLIELKFDNSISDTGSAGALWTSVGDPLVYDNVDYKYGSASLKCGFDSTTQKIGTTTPVLTNAGAFTVSCWLKIVQFPPLFQQNIWRVLEQETNGCVFFAYTDGVLDHKLHMNSSTLSSPMIFNDILGLETWYHVAFTFDTQVRGYLDGVLKQTQTATRAFETGAGFEVGQFGTVGIDKGLYGWIDNFRVYNRALTASEIALDAANSPIPDSNITNAIPRMVGSTATLQTSLATVDDQGVLASKYIRMPTELTIPMYPSYSYVEDIQTGMYSGGAASGKTIFASAGLPVGQFDVDGITCASGKTIGVFGEYRLPAASGDVGQMMISAGNNMEMTWATPITSGGSSTDNALVRWDSTTGTVIQNSSATLSDAGQIVATSANFGSGVLLSDAGGGQKRITLSTSTLTGNADDVLELVADNTIDLRPGTSAIINIAAAPRLLVTAGTTTSYNTFACDTLYERTPSAGIVADGVHLKDSGVKVSYTKFDEGGTTESLAVRGPTYDTALVIPYLLMPFTGDSHIPSYGPTPTPEGSGGVYVDGKASAPALGRAYNNQGTARFDWGTALNSTLNGLSSWTFCTWANFNTVGGSIIKHQAGSSDQFSLIFNGSNLQWKSNGVSIIGASAITTGVWYWICVVQSGTTCTLYVNNASDGVDTSASVLILGADNTSLFARQDGAVPSNCILDDVSIYTSAISSGQRASIYSIGGYGAGDLSTDNCVMRWDGVTGQRAQNSVVVIADDGAITTPGVISCADPTAASHAVTKSFFDARRYMQQLCGVTASGASETVFSWGSVYGGAAAIPHIWMLPYDIRIEEFRIIADTEAPAVTATFRIYVNGSVVNTYTSASNISAWSTSPPVADSGTAYYDSSQTVSLSVSSGSRIATTIQLSGAGTPDITVWLTYRITPGGVLSTAEAPSNIVEEDFVIV